MQNIYRSPVTSGMKKIMEAVIKYGTLNPGNNRVLFAAINYIEKTPEINRTTSVTYTEKKLTILVLLNCQDEFL